MEMKVSAALPLRKARDRYEKAESLRLVTG